MASIWSVSTLANPQITNATQVGETTTLSGRYFGPRCEHCEVVADYGSFKYALPIERWEADRISVTLPDLGVGKSASLEVRTDAGRSAPVLLTLPKKLIPMQRLDKMASADTAGDLQYFERSYDLSIGGKGTDSFDVSQPQPTCGETAKVFDSADIVIGRHTRFGDARKVESPQSGCAICSPVKVRYYFEPTGKLEYQLHVYRREISGVCDEQIRN